MAALCLGVALLVVLASYAYAVAIGPVATGGIVSAAALVAIGGTSLLYAWRAVTGVSSE